MGAMREKMTSSNPDEFILDALEPADVFLCDAKE